MFSPRIWVGVVSVAFILVVALTLGGPSQTRPRSSAERTLLNRVVANSGGPESTSSTVSPVGHYLAVAFVTGENSRRTPTTTALALSTTSILNGDPVTFTATVKPASGTGTPTGTVTFLDDTAKLGTVPLNGSGVAKLTNSSLDIGAHGITAVYSGDQNFAPSTSAVVAISVAGMGGLPAALAWPRGFAR